MNAKQKTHLETVLRREQKRLGAVLGAIQGASDTDDAPGDDSEAGAAGAGPLDDVAVAARETVALREVDAALQLLRESPDRYGVCVTCGRAISMDRLEILPATTRCERHADHSRKTARAVIA